MTDGIDVKITDPKLLEGITQKVLWEALDQKGRDELMRQALYHLTHGGSQYGSKTPIQLAFERAIDMIAEELVRKVVAETPQFREKVNELVTAAIADALSTTNSSVRRSVAEAIARGFNER